MTIQPIANLESGLSVRDKLNDLITISNGGLYNPYEFGATGNGGVDDTAAMIATFTAAQTDGWGVILPAPATFRVTSSLPAFTNGMIVVGGGLYTLGGAVYGFKFPDPSPRYFGFHEVFHSFTVLAFAAHYVGVSLATYSLR